MFNGGASWHDTDKLALNVSVIMLYIVGLLSFQKMTGLMDLGKPTQMVKLHPQHRVYDAYETKRVYSQFDPSTTIKDSSSPMFQRHLLSAEVDADNIPAAVNQEETAEDNKEI